ncbi:hypothetical protein [Alkalihalophilus marmarensis]|uniref:hypothetical protein n=1 Tax=Alkalihalophilus marmarensis TaxID=521377 RepID=UPI00059E33CA|nr:hypothetical protein [Alkalihalophilus marmarensis]
MPTTKKEKLYFGLMMCTGMVIFMTFYNLIIHDMLGKIPLSAIVLQLAAGFILAFIVESFIVGPAAHKLAFALPYDKSKKLYSILSLAFFMVTGMVLVMSLFGLGTAYYFTGLGDKALIESYFSIVLMNYLFALPLQLFIVGPTVRRLFTKFVKTPVNEPIEPLLLRVK